MDVNLRWKNIIYARCSPLCHSLKMDYRLIAFVKPQYLWFLHRNSRGMPETTRERIKKDETTEVIGTLLMPPQPLFERHSKSPDWMELMLFCSPAASFTREQFVSSRWRWEAVVSARKWVNESDEWNKRKIAHQKRRISAGGYKSSCSDWPVCLITEAILPRHMKTWGIRTPMDKKRSERAIKDLGYFRNVFSKGATSMACRSLSVFPARGTTRQSKKASCRTRPVNKPARGGHHCPAPATITREQVQLCSLR